MMAKHVIITDRFLLRELQGDDITERYLAWFNDHEVKKWITAASEVQTLSGLRRYVLDQVGCDDIFFWGVFDKNIGLHIGNIKYELVSSVKGIAIMGILVGEPTYRGNGVAAEVLRASALWLKENHKVSQILLGVSQDNFVAIRAYEKVGFVVAKISHIEPRPGVITMSWQL